MTFILLIAVIILIIVLISNKNKFQKTINDLQNIINSLNAKIKSFEQERENLNQKIESLEDNNNALKKYQGIVDTEQKAINWANENGLEFLSNQDLAFDHKNCNHYTLHEIIVN